MPVTVRRGTCPRGPFEQTEHLGGGRLPVGIRGPGPALRVQQEKLLLRPAFLILIDEPLEAHAGFRRVLVAEILSRQIDAVLGPPCVAGKIDDDLAVGLDPLQQTRKCSA